MPAGVLSVGQDVLIIVLITVALGEFGLRIYNYVDPLPIFYGDSYNRFRGKPFAPDPAEQPVRTVLGMVRFFEF